MIEVLNLLLLKKFEGPEFPSGSDVFITRWLEAGQNYQRLQRECEKIWIRQFEDEHYDVERAFTVLGRRLLGISINELRPIL